jgi:hypothetical protein
VRASIDPDDFSGGFGVWSGTSFSAPVIAGRLAASIDAYGPAPTLPDRMARASAVIDTVLAEAKAAMVAAHTASPTALP